MLFGLIQGGRRLNGNDKSLAGTCFSCQSPCKLSDPAVRTAKIVQCPGCKPDNQRSAPEHPKLQSGKSGKPASHLSETGGGYTPPQSEHASHHFISPGVCRPSMCLLDHSRPVSIMLSHLGHTFPIPYISFLYHLWCPHLGQIYRFHCPDAAAHPDLVRSRRQHPGMAKSASSILSCPHARITSRRSPDTKEITLIPWEVMSSCMNREIAPQTRVSIPIPASRFIFLPGLFCGRSFSTSRIIRPDSTSTMSTCRATSKTGAIRPFQKENAAFMVSLSSCPFDHAWSIECAGMAGSDCILKQLKIYWILRRH